MIRSSQLTLIWFSVLLVALGCDRPTCKNTNEVLAKYGPDKKEYKDELIRQLDLMDKSELSYWADAYWNRMDKGKIVSEYIRVHVQGDGLCAKMILAVKDSRKGIEQLLENQMIGYKGAKLEGLQYEVYQDSTKTEFIFKEVTAIVD